MLNLICDAQSYEVRMSSSRGVPYFFDTETQQSTWEPPAGLSQAQIDALPGAHYLSGNGGGNGKVRASHLLVKHKDSRRPSSWKEVRFRSLIAHHIRGLVLMVL